jgi:hypothetical protein
MQPTKDCNHETHEIHERQIQNPIRVDLANAAAQERKYFSVSFFSFVNFVCFVVNGSLNRDDLADHRSF